MITKNLFEKVIQINPKNDSAYYGLAKLFFFDFDKKNAIINIDIAIKINCENDKYKVLKNRIKDELTDE